jgi:hypothetical protein
MTLRDPNMPSRAVRIPLGVVTLMIAAALVASDAGAQHGPGQHGMAPPSAAPAKDGRQRVMLARADRETVLAEMRMMLESVSGVVQGLANNDTAAAERALRGPGMMHPLATNQKLRKQLPKGFLDLGDQLHKGLDGLADRFKAGATKDEGLKMLGTVTATCVACHATYRLDERR